jgi:hypothetical protein
VGGRTIVVEAPRVDGADLVLSWREDPPSGVYRRREARLRFPPPVDLAAVPERLRWTVALLCLHPQWVVAGPATVALPVRLGPGEAEAWMRLMDATAHTHDRTAAAHRRARGEAVGPPPGRSVELVEGDGELAEAPPAPDEGRCTTAFSGGKDSLLQLALLHELGRRPIAVTTTSPLPDRHDHTSARRRQVLAEVARRLPVDVVEVASDLRAAVDNDAPGRLGWHTSVTEMTDTFLYLAACLVVGWAWGAPRAHLASEAEVQANVELDGGVVQHPHAMYSAATQAAVSALLAPLGMAHSSLTYPLPSGLVQDLLWRRYPEVRDLQYSCWRAPADRAACSACTQCLRVSLAALAAGGDPRTMGIDLVALLVAQRGWRPAEPGALGLPDDEVRASLHAQVVANLAAVAPEAVEALLADERWPRRRRAARAYRDLRVGALAAPAPAATPGVRVGYLDLVDPDLRAGLAEVFAAYPAADPASYAAALDRTRRLARWITSPLSQEHVR